MGHEVTRENLFKLFIIRECKGTVATLLTLTVVTLGVRNILLSVSYQEHNCVPSSVGSGQEGRERLPCSLKSLAISLVMSLYLGRQESGYAILVAGFFFFPYLLVQFLGVNWNSLLII